MNLRENIRRILREEQSLIPLIRRRVPMDVLESEFNESLEMSVDMYLRNYTRLSVKEGLKQFIHQTISIMIDGIHWMIYSTIDDDFNWYDEVFNSLKKFYMGRILDRWNNGELI